MLDWFSRLRARLRTHGGTSETSVVGCVVVMTAVVALILFCVYVLLWRF